MNYQGDIVLGDTIDIKFTTVSTTGVPTTLAGSPAVAAYMDNDPAEITAGITLSVDFDSRAGLHNIRVVATSGNGFTTGKNINLVVTAGTVSGNSVVGYVVGSFSIQKRSSSSQASVDAIKAKTDQLNFISGDVRSTLDGEGVTVSDKTGYALTSAYDPAKTAAQAGDAMALTSGERSTLSAAIWAVLTSTLSVANSIGKWIKDSLPGITPGSAGGLFIAGSNSPTNVNITGNRTGDLIGNVTGNVQSVVNTLTPSEIANAVRDVSNASPAVGSLGADVKTGAVGGDPWSIALPGAYGAGTAGKILGEKLDVLVSSRLASVAYTNPPAVGTIAVAVRDVDNTNPASGSLGDKVNNAASAGDPWGTVLPGSYAANTAGKIIGEKLDVLVSSRLADNEYVDPPSAVTIAESVRDVNNQTPAANSLGAAVNAAASAGDPWSTPLPGSYPAGSAGKLMSDQLDAKVSTRLAAAAYTVPPTTNAIAVATRDINNTSPASGSLGDKVNSAASAGDPWTTSLPGTYPAGTAGKIIGDNVDAKISVMLPNASYVIPPSTGQISEAVRDVDNTNPAANSLGAAINEGSDPLANPVPGSYPAGTAGKILGDNLDAKVSTRSTYGGNDTPGTTTLLSRIASALNITAGKVDVNDKTGFSLTSAYDPAKTAAQAGSPMTLTPAERMSLADAVWQSLTSALSMVGSVGKLIVDNLNAPVASRLATASYVAPDNSSIAQIKAKTDTLPTDVASAGDIPTSVENANAVRDVSNAAPVSGSLGADIKSASISENPWAANLPGSYPAGTAGNILGVRLDANVSSRLASSAIDLTNGEVTVAINNDKGFAPGQENLIADAILKRDWQAVSGEPAYCILNALRLVRNKWEVTPDGTLRVWHENGSAIAWTRSVVSDPEAQPIVGVS